MPNEIERVAHEALCSVPMHNISPVCLEVPLDRFVPSMVMGTLTNVINPAKFCCDRYFRGFDSVGVKIRHFPLTNWPVAVNSVCATWRWWVCYTVCPEKSEPPKHFALTSANMPRIEQN